MRLRFSGLAGDVLDPVTDLRVSGPSIPVQIGFDPTFDPTSEGRPQIRSEEYFALVDTGAGESCIDNALAEALDLPVMGREPLAGAGGLSMTNVYIAHVYVPEMAFTLFGRFMGVELLAARQPHLALLGRDFLSNFTLTYEGRTGIAILSDE